MVALSFDYEAGHCEWTVQQNTVSQIPHKRPNREFCDGLVSPTGMCACVRWENPYQSAIL